MKNSPLPLYRAALRALRELLHNDPTSHTIARRFTRQKFEEGKMTVQEGWEAVKMVQRNVVQAERRRGEGNYRKTATKSHCVDGESRSVVHERRKCRAGRALDAEIEKEAYKDDRV